MLLLPLILLYFVPFDFRRFCSLPLFVWYFIIVGLKRQPEYVQKKDDYIYITLSSGVYLFCFFSLQHSSTYMYGRQFIEDQVKNSTCDDNFFHFGMMFIAGSVCMKKVGWHWRKSYQTKPVNILSEMRISGGKSLLFFLFIRFNLNICSERTKRRAPYLPRAVCRTTLYLLHIYSLLWLLSISSICLLTQ